MVQRYAMVWVLLLLTAPAWSGSWSDDFEDAASVDWEEAGEPNNWTESDGFLNGELVEVDSRPSDALAISVHYDPPLPLFVHEDVLAEVL